ncbi:RRXRR domain-containing protein, partial [Limnoraphis robusta]
MSNYVFVVDSDKQPYNPIHPAQARLLLSQKKAAILRRYPFTIILKEKVENVEIKPLTLKTDPGSKVTGLALVSEENVIWGAELTHRSQQ